MYKVIQWATGTLGSEAMARVIDDPDRELVGVYTYSADKVGKDAGDLCGRPKTGILATNRVEDILALEADVVLHLPKLETITTNSDREVVALLESGKNVISSRGYQFPRAHGVDYEALFVDAGRKGNATLFGTGIEPGFIYDTLAGTISGMCARIDEIRLWQWFDLTSRPPNTVFNVCLIGKDPAKVDETLPFARTVGELYREEFSLIAAHLGTTLTTFDLKVHAIAAPEDVVIPNGGPGVKGETVAKGTSWGIVLDFRSKTADEKIINFRMCWFVAPVPGWVDHDEYGIEIKGEPNLRLTFEYEDKWTAAHDPFHTMVGAHFNNIIPKVVEAAPGILHLAPHTLRSEAANENEPAGAFFGKAVVVTGGTAGLGLAMAEALLRGGAQVIVTGRDATRGRKAEAFLQDIGQAWFEEHDITAELATAELDAAVSRRFGRLDGIINNVGGNVVKPIAETSYVDFLEMARTNLFSAWRGLRWAARRMEADGRGGAIVNIASMAALYAHPGVAPYCTAKAMVGALTRAAASEFAGSAIRVNAIYPGIFMTELTERTTFPDTAARVSQLARIPMGRFGRPAELGGLACFLISDFATGVTGADFVADGGRTAC